MNRALDVCGICLNRTVVRQPNKRLSRKVEDNYWGEGATTLEWTLSSPPPFHQFETLPVIK